MAIPSLKGAKGLGQPAGKRAPSPKHTTALDKRIGAKVRALRLEHDISQQQLGTKLGITFQQIQKYEQGTNRIGAGRLYEIAAVFGVTVQSFFEEARGGGKATESPKLADFLTQLGRVRKQEDRRELLSVMTRFADQRS